MRKIFIGIICILALIAGYWMFSIGMILLKAFIGLMLISIFVLGFLTAKVIYKPKE